MGFQSFITATFQEIEKEMSRLFLTWENTIARSDPILLPLAKKFIESNRGGKRIRGSLVVLGYVLSGKKMTHDIFTTACAYEIFQTAILIHDDIIDRSQTRRGVQTFFRQLNGSHYGISQALSIGDLGFFLALQTLSDIQFPEERKKKGINSFINAMYKTTVGQIHDVELAHEKKYQSQDSILDMYQKKTAQYTIIGPLSLGAILAGAREDFLFSLEHFGKYLGIGFQLQDDLLGFIGNEKERGKSVISDIQEGKSTLLYFLAQKHANIEQKKILDEVYGKKKIDVEDVLKIKEIFQKTKALYLVRNILKENIKKSNEEIKKIPIEEKDKILLGELVHFLVPKEMYE